MQDAVCTFNCKPAGYHWAQVGLLVFGVCCAPSTGSQLSTVQELPSSTGTGSVPTQVPVWHASVCVQALLSVQVVPSAATGLEQVPVLGLHVPIA